MIKKTNLFSILIIFLLIEVSIIFNNSVIKIRLGEADYHLYKVALNHFAGNTFIITSKYNMIKKQINSRDNLNDEYSLEGQIQAILTQDNHSLPKMTYKPLPNYHPVSLVLMSLRFILGKEQIIQPEKRDFISRNLELAYFLERNRNYHKAIKIYDQIINTEFPEEEVYSSIMIHQAFCFSMLGDFNRSYTIYDDIHSQFPETEAGILSGKMKYFLLDLIKRNQALLASRKSNLEIGRQLYLNMNYDEALVYLEKETSNGTPIEKSEAHYYKGRIHEELGEFRKAIKSYFKIMHLGRDTRWSMDANRRLVMLEDLYKYQHPLTKDAEKNLKEMNDTQFLEDINELKEIITISPDKKELLEKNRNETDISEDSLFQSIKIVPEPKKIKKEEVRPRISLKARKEIRKKRVLTEEEKIEMKRKLANNKLRKASLIRNTIEKNTPKLQKIYLDYTKSGNLISGEVIVEMHIHSSGMIDATIKKSSITDKTFTKKVIREINRWRFPALKEDLGILTISYPFNFKE